MRCNATKCLLGSIINFGQSPKGSAILCENPVHRAISQFECSGRKRLFHTTDQDGRHSWSVLKRLHQKSVKDANQKYACLLLNVLEESHQHYERYKYIWNGANLKVAVDGSANYLAGKGMIHTAHLVCGDFDSIDPKILKELQFPTQKAPLSSAKGRETGADTIMPVVVETPDQRETDFTKAMRVAQGMRPDVHFFFGLYYSRGDRIDHIFSLVNTLHQMRKNIVLINIASDTVSWLLFPGNHTIQKQPGREMCSLVPFTGPTHAKTQGLEYNLKQSSELSFGRMISSCNISQEKSESLTVETNRDLLWSIELRN